MHAFLVLFAIFVYLFVSVGCSRHRNWEHTVVPAGCTYATGQDEACQELPAALEALKVETDQRTRLLVEYVRSDCDAGLSLCHTFHEPRLFDQRRSAIEFVAAGKGGESIVRGFVYAEPVPEGHYAHASVPLCFFTASTSGTTERALMIACEHQALQQILESSEAFIDAVLSEAGRHLNRSLIIARRSMTDKARRQAAESRQTARDVENIFLFFVGFR